MVEEFETHRPRLMGVAYGMLGTVMDAEDVIQEAYLRWITVEKPVREPVAFLTTMVTRLAIDRLRSAVKRRETYVGPWLPEPIVSPLAGDVADVVAEAEQISLALMTAMERLNPVERAAFLLRDVFDFDYPDIADVIDRSPSNTRQIVSRARTRVGDSARARPADAAENERLLAAFGNAVTTGDLDGLVTMLAEDVVAWSDGGSERRAARHPILGANRVARFLLGLAAKSDAHGAWVAPARANGGPAFVVLTADGPYSVMALDTRDGIIGAIRTMVNPAKLATVGRIDWDDRGDG